MILHIRQILHQWLCRSLGQFIQSVLTAAKKTKKRHPSNGYLRAVNTARYRGIILLASENIPKQGNATSSLWHAWKYRCINWLKEFQDFPCERSRGADTDTNLPTALTLANQPNYKTPRGPAEKPQIPFEQTLYSHSSYQPPVPENGQHSRISSLECTFQTRRMPCRWVVWEPLESCQRDPSHIC